MPSAGVDYPKTWSQFLEWFHSEDAYRTCLEDLRWPEGSPSGWLGGFFELKE